MTHSANSGALLAASASPFLKEYTGPAGAAVGGITVIVQKILSFLPDDKSHALVGKTWHQAGKPKRIHDLQMQAQNLFGQLTALERKMEQVQVEGIRKLDRKAQALGLQERFRARIRGVQNANELREARDFILQHWTNPNTMSKAERFFAILEKHSKAIQQHENERLKLKQRLTAVVAAMNQLKKP